MTIKFIRRAEKKCIQTQWITNSCAHNAIYVCTYIYGCVKNYDQQSVYFQVFVVLEVREN